MRIILTGAFDMKLFLLVLVERSPAHGAQPELWPAFRTYQVTSAALVDRRGPE